MGDKRPYKPRKPGVGRKPLKPDYDAAAIQQEQMQSMPLLKQNRDYLIKKLWKRWQKAVEALQSSQEVKMGAKLKENSK